MNARRQGCKCIARRANRPYGHSQAGGARKKSDAQPFAGEAGWPRSDACMRPRELRFQDRPPDVDRSQVVSMGSKGRSQEERGRLRSRQRLGSACIS